MTAFDEVMVMGTSHFSQGGHFKGSRFSGTDIIDAEGLKIYSYVPQTSAGVDQHGITEAGRSSPIPRLSPSFCRSH